MATFTETETQQDTATSFGFTSRASNTNQLENQLDFSSAVPYSGFSNYLTQTEEAEESVPSYEVEREYNINTLPEDEVIIPTFMPMVNSPKPEVKDAADYKIKLNARGKIIASVFRGVVGFLVAFMIYNAVIITKLTNSLAYLEVEKASRGAGITSLESEYQDITSYKHLEMRAADLGFSYSPETNDVAISLAPRPEIQEPKESTNWFNELCEFFANLF